MTKNKPLTIKECKAEISEIKKFIQKRAELSNKMEKLQKNYPVMAVAQILAYFLKSNVKIIKQARDSNNFRCSKLIADLDYFIGELQEPITAFYLRNFKNKHDGWDILPNNNNH